LTSRWSPAKGYTYYGYDDVGNLTSVNYPASPDISLTYDALNRVTSQVDAAGSTSYTYTYSGNLATEDGPWANDTVTYTYHSSVPRLRTSLSLQQPSGAWNNGLSYDATKCLQTLTGPMGNFTYTYKGAGNLWTNLALPNIAAVTNDFDGSARMLGTYLRNSSGAILNKHTYLYNTAHERTRHTRTDGSYVSFTYDNISQLKTAVGSGGQSTENLGYLYDTAWNLNKRTNNGVVATFIVDNKNQLTNAPSVGTQTYDDNGNVTYSAGNSRGYGYDDENRLVNWYYYDGGYNGNGQPTSPADLRSEFVYDGLGRLRKRVEYTATSNYPYSWGVSSETRYIYDGRLVIQERNGSNTPTVSYTRGIDLSGSFQGAGGIGGLLARSHGYSGGNWSTHNYYHADGGGNVTYMISSAQAMVASCKYDPYGKTLSSSGALAGVNVYRFSSKEIHVNSGLYYYGYRFYDPNLQRWLNQDPLGEKGFELTHGSTAFVVMVNSYTFVGNEPVHGVDLFGLQRPPIIQIIFPPSTGGNSLNCILISRTEPITGDPTPGKENHNGETVCIWRCNYFGDQIASGPPITLLTFAKPNKPCLPPKDPRCGRKAKVITGPIPPYMSDWFKVPDYE
jgi:RHS repeat-associated protein